MISSTTVDGPESLPALAARLRALDAPYPAKNFAGRGIVIVAGGAGIFTNAYVLVQILRHTLNCSLPIEVWHFGAGEISPSMASLLVDLEVRVIDAMPVIAEHGAAIRDGWQLKPFALMWSRFAEVLMLDADQVPAIDPSGLFDWPEFATTGAVFWPDVVDLRQDNAIWAAMGLPAQRSVSLESGQILVDKSRHWRALSIALGLNAEAERLYRLIYGDKDTFLLAWLLADARYALVPHRPFVDTRVLVQRDFAGRPLFQHRTGAKWRYGDEQAEIPGFIHYAACLAALADLEARWNGRVFSPPSRSVAARAIEAELASAGALALQVVGEEPILLELHHLGELGAGRSYDRQNWWVEADSIAEDEFRLLIADGDRCTYQFEQLSDDAWQGRRLRWPAADAVLQTVRSRTDLPPAMRASLPGLVDDLLRAAGFPAAQDNETRRLADALVLLARVDSGVVARLDWLADAAANTGDPAIAARLEELAKNAARANSLDWKKVDRDSSVLTAGYQRDVAE